MLNLKALFRRKPKILILINLIQDLDILLPLSLAFSEFPSVDFDIAVIDRAWNESPRIERLLLQAGITPKRVARAAVITGLQPSLTGVKALITASESNSGPHRAAYELTQRANHLKIATFTLQHGFENVGLTYSNDTYPVEASHFASQTIFIWGGLETLHPDIPEVTRKKCIAVGCPKYVKPPDAKLTFTHSRSQLIVVFENLHWERYDDSYRSNFLVDVNRTAHQFPQITFLVKPHHAGRWLTERHGGERPRADNLVIADPLDPQWEGFTAPALLEIADAAITTPSTVALDAARLQRPVAVVGYDMDLDKYQPLPTFRQSRDWIEWIDRLQTIEGYSTLQQAGQDFLQRQVVPGDAVSHIVRQVVDQIKRA
jgi:hypothetical protein